LKDKKNKEAYTSSAQIACEAAAAIRAVASLMREEDLYIKRLEKPLEETTKTAVWSNMVFTLSVHVTQGDD